MVVACPLGTCLRGIDEAPRRRLHVVAWRAARAGIARIRDAEAAEGAVLAAVAVLILAVASVRLATLLTCLLSVRGSHTLLVSPAL